MGFAVTLPNAKQAEEATRSSAGVLVGSRLRTKLESVGQLAAGDRSRDQYADPVRRRHIIFLKDAFGDLQPYPRASMAALWGWLGAAE